MSSPPTSRTVSLNLKRLLLVHQVPSVYRPEKGCTLASREVGDVATRNAQEAAGRNVATSVRSTCRLPLQFLPRTCVLSPLATCLIIAPSTHPPIHSANMYRASISLVTGYKELTAQLRNQMTLLGKAACGHQGRWPIRASGVQCRKVLRPGV